MRMVVCIPFLQLLKTKHANSKNSDWMNAVRSGFLLFALTERYNFPGYRVFELLFYLSVVFYLPLVMARGDQQR